jgi:hypothetical protein
VGTSNCVGGGRRAAAAKAWFGLTRSPFRILSIVPLRSKSCRGRKSRTEGRWELLPSSIACSRPCPALNLFLENTTHSTLSKLANNYFSSLQACKNQLLSLFIKYVVTFTWELGNVFLTCTWARCGSSDRSVSSPENHLHYVTEGIVPLSHTWIVLQHSSEVAIVEFVDCNSKSRPILWCLWKQTSLTKLLHTQLPSIWLCEITLDLLNCISSSRNITLKAKKIPLSMINN